MLFVLFAILSPHKARDIFSVHWLHWLHLKTTYLNFTSFSAATTRSWQGEETYDVSCELLRGNVSRWRLTKISLMVSWYRKHNIIPVYYMASSASGQDEQNRALWLATRAGKMEPSCLLAFSGLPAVSRKQNFIKSHIINPLLTKFAWSRWLDIGLVLFFCEFVDLDFVSVYNHAKKELGQYPAILTSHLVNNPYLIHKFSLLAMTIWKRHLLEEFV